MLDGHYPKMELMNGNDFVFNDFILDNKNYIYHPATI